MNEVLYPALYAPKDGYVFVVTYGRSGSTLTQSLLNAIPGYCIRGENGNLPYHLARAVSVTNTWDDYTWRREDKDKNEDQQKDFLRGLIGTPSDPWYGAENIDPMRFCRAMMNVFVGEVQCPPSGTRVSGFKEIRFHEDSEFCQKYMEIMRAAFPKARFIFQKRNAGDVANSSWWGSRPKEDVLKMVRDADQQFHQFATMWPEISYTVEYEKYSNGYEYARKMFDFLQENPKRYDVDAILQKKLKH
ncbi:sulfotransferase [Paracoccus aestuariivivens]|uniref:Sulfotransferase n=1 Tax=Paracoccus aestuariivivens TaxID=1820333 RepID=A0A6L6JK95_9RHOB|nr:sulfotransferase [Paracoccus aestuariivivens]MTH80301.1 hypothetical protein [Paracoccus aestuariivivens]